ncbi:MAG: hypothetical protein VXW65_04535 [Pseudomonadota bacterium]|nr:hypothetical protein [Pseudomonadota bacterium]
MTITLSPEDLGQLARFKLMMRQEHQYSVDLSELIADPHYAKDTLDLAEETDREELMMLAIELRAKLGFLLAQPTPPMPTQSIESTKTAPEAPNTAQEPRDRYRFSLR